MDKKLRDAWADDLESGKFVQAQGLLHKVKAEGATAHERRLKSNRAGYCCLGVLSERICRLKAVKDTGWKWSKGHWTNEDGWGKYEGTLPAEVSEAIKIGSDTIDEFIELNDDEGSSFKKIAKIIRENDLLTAPLY